MLVDEQFGADIPQGAREHGLKLAMPVEKSGQNEFDFDYGDDFGAHIESFDPDFSKVLVRYNPDDDPVMNERQLGRLKRLADWLHEHDRKFLFELLVPATDEQLASVGGDTDRYDAELRPELMRRAIEAIQDVGIEVDVWKIEGVDEREDAADARRADPLGAGARGRRLRAARPRRLDREGRALARAGRSGRRLHRLRDRPLDLVGRAQGLPRQAARARGRGLRDRRQLPAFRPGLRGRDRPLTSEHVATDPGALDRAQRAAWQRAAGAWGKWQASIRDATHIVSQWMVDAIDPQPGEQVLDLAAGPGETGFIAARRLGDDGRLTSTDQSEEMVSVARRRAEELELHNVRFAVLDAQRIELDPASFDAALCRFGYMLMGDPDAALRGTHRVLKPGGRVALAVWDAPDRNVWMVALPAQLVARGALPPPAPDAPTPFSMAEVVIARATAREGRLR